MTNRKLSSKDAVPSLLMVIALTAATFCLFTATAGQSNATTNSTFTVLINGAGVTVPDSCSHDKDCLRITANTTTAQINEGSNCWKIANKTTKDIFIPTKTQAEFDSFRTTHTIASPVATVSPCSAGSCLPTTAATTCGNVTLPMTEKGASTGDLPCPGTCTGTVHTTCNADGTFAALGGSCIDTICNPASPTITAGDGSAAKPYLICNCAQLQTIPDNSSFSYQLTQNIDCAETSAWNNGLGFNMIPQFRGVLDGNHKAISNLRINRPSASFSALFNYLAGNIRNIGLENVSVSGLKAAGLVIETTSDSSISNSYVTGTVIAAQDGISGGIAGGLVASVRAGTSITNSYSAATVTGAWAGGLVGHTGGSITNSYATGTVSGTYYAGGLVGTCSGGSITNSYATATVAGLELGGLVGGFYSGFITNSFAAGSVPTSGPGMHGGLVSGSSAGGDVQPMTNSITNSRWDKIKSEQTVACNSDCPGATAFETSNDPFSSAKAPLASWDFSGIWQSVNCNYPNLRNVGGAQNAAKQECPLPDGWYSMSPAGSSSCITSCASKGMHWTSSPVLRQGFLPDMCHINSPQTAYGYSEWSDGIIWYCSGMSLGVTFTGITDQCYCESQGWSGTGCAACPEGSNYYFLINEYPVCNPPAVCTNGATYGGTAPDNMGTCNYDPSGRDEQSYWSMKCK